ncbi:unnamed protein product [Merluccius merluccius]
MSGRDLRAFITSYRSQDGRGKHLAWTRGGSAAARPTEYQRLEAALEARRQESETIAQKRLILYRGHDDRAAATESHRWATNLPTTRSRDTGGSDVTLTIGLYLERERELFKMATVDPVLQLRDDLRFRRSELLQRRLPLRPSAGLQIQQQVNLVKELQEAVMGRLGAELQAFEEEIAALGLEDCVACGSEVEPDPVPVEVLYADCPWPELKLFLLQSFDGLAERYQARRRSLKQRLGGTDRWCGWPASDHLCFQWTVGQYGPDLADRRALCSDMLLRLLPHRSRQELVSSLYLERERELFKMATVDPVLQLRDDLRFRRSELLQRRLPLRPSAGLQIQQQVNLVKELQEAVMGRLGAELQAFEEEIAALGLEDCVACGSEVEPDPVPVEVLYADCPWPELKLFLLQSFDGLAERYQARRRSLKQRLGGTDRWCGWPASDHLCFQWTVGQYGPDLADRRALCSDMLLRLLPHRSRQELVSTRLHDLLVCVQMDHERVWDWQRFSQAQLQALARGWQRDRGELLTRALEVLEEARRDHQGELDLHREHRLQLETCARLRDTLQQWRAQQEVVSQQEAAMAARRQEKEEELLGQKRENEASMRSHQRDQLKEFYWRQQERRERLEKRDEERQARLRRTMEEQARRDKERVRYREEALQVRRREREALELQQQREQEERQTRLEALRTQVAVVAEADPERMMGQTEAWRSRQQKDGVGLLKPLYNINTYTDSQIVSDPRVRVELALREAGLHETRYAQQVLSDIQPPRPPRRDTVSANHTSGPLAL